MARAAETVGLSRWAEAIAREALPSLRLGVASRDDGPFGSRLGGDPAMPEDYPWPEWQGRPQSFVGQIRLTDLGGFGQDFGLPRDGLLSFFYDSEQSTWGFDPADRGSAEVAWFPATARLAIRSLPQNHDETARFAAKPINLAREWTLPPWPSPEMDRIGLQAAYMASTGNELGVLYDALDGLLAGGTPRAPRHRMFGHPDQIQNEMREECEFVTHGHYLGGGDGRDVPERRELEANARLWRLLLQVDSDESIGTMWGDVGRIYFWIREDALTTRAFDRTWLILQCG